MPRNISSSGEQQDAALTASKRVYIELRQRIIEMSLLPGTRIVERDIAAEHGVIDAGDTRLPGIEHHNRFP